MVTEVSATLVATTTLRQRIGRESQVLFFCRQITVQRNQREALVSVHGAKRIDRGVDFAHAGHEHEDVAGRVGVDDTFYHIRRLLSDGSLVVMIEVANFDGITLAFGNEDGTYHVRSPAFRRRVSRTA